MKPLYGPRRKPSWLEAHWHRIFISATYQKAARATWCWVGLYLKNLKAGRSASNASIKAVTERRKTKIERRSTSTSWQAEQADHSEDFSLED